MESVDCFQSTSKFYDDINFPYGFNSSGYFTRAESEILERCGKTLIALQKGLMIATNQDQLNFLLTCEGNRLPSSVVEKAWAVYQKAIASRGVVLKTVAGVN